MSEFRNRVITISGNPSSGKGTVIKQLRADYESKGYNVHIFSVGHEFRKLAAEKGLSIEEFNEYMAKRGSVDQMIDSTVAQRGKEIHSKERPHDIYIFDSRLAFHNIPDSFSIRLTADDNVAGQRAFGDKTRGYASLEEAIEKTRERKESEVARYLKRYGINLQDLENYNLVIDTSYSRVEDIASVIEQCLELDLEQKFYGKMWTSPKRLLPLQTGRETGGKGWGSGLTLDQFVEKLKEEGYDPSSEIEVVQVDNKLGIQEGHHRNIGAWVTGKTLVPYVVTEKDNDRAKNWMSSLRKNDLWDHEVFFDEKDENGKVTKTFSYNEVYQGIYDELNKPQDRER